MDSRRVAWLLLVMVGLAAWWAAGRRDRAPIPEGPPMSRPSADEVVRMFGGGPSDDPERDAALRRQLVGRWGRSDSDLVYLDFAADGGLRGADMTSDPVAVAEGKEPFAASGYVGRWGINDGFLRLHKPDMVTVQRLRFTDDDRLQLYDSIERIDQAHVYHRLPPDG